MWMQGWVIIYNLHSIWNWLENMRPRFAKITWNLSLASKKKSWGVPGIFPFSWECYIIQRGTHFRCNLKPLFGRWRGHDGGGVYISVPVDRACSADTCGVLLRGGLSCCSLPSIKPRWLYLKFKGIPPSQYDSPSFSCSRCASFFLAHREKGTWQRGGSKQRETIAQTPKNPEMSQCQLVTKSVKCQGS